MGNEPEPTDTRQGKVKRTGAGIAIGIAIGIALGVALGASMTRKR